MYSLVNISLQRLYGTFLLASVAENALRGVLALAGVVVYLHVHRTDFQTFAAMDAFAFVATDAQHGEVTHRLEEDRDGTDVLAEGAVVFEDHGECDADRVVEQIADQEQHEQGVCSRFSKVHQQENEYQRTRKYDVADEPQLSSWTLRLLVRQQVENHGRPAGIAAPAPTEEQRSEYLGNGVMQNARPRHTGKQVVPEPFNLHVLLANQPEEDEHVGAHAKLDELPGVFLLRRHQQATHPDAGADVGEVEQEEQVASRQPQRYGNDLEHDKQDDGGSVLFHGLLYFVIYCTIIR